MSVDPVTADGNTGGNFNRYWYANNNPYRFFDPDGREDKEIRERKDWRSLDAHPSLAGANGSSVSLHSESGSTKGSKSSAPASNGSHGASGSWGSSGGSGTWAPSPPNEALEPVCPECYVIVALRGVRSLMLMTEAGGAEVAAAPEISFGRNVNQIFHTFRHVEGAGLNREVVQRAVLSDLRVSASRIEAGAPFNQTITVGGRDITYTAFKLENGAINVGRITLP